MTQVTIHGLEKSFGPVPVLRGVSVDVATGEFLTLLGPSGCGKSTLLRIIAGLEAQDRGTIAIGGRPADHLRPKQRDVAMVFQSYALYPHMTVAENLGLPLRMRQMSLAQRLPVVGRLVPGRRAALAGIERKVRSVAQALEIEHLLGRKPGQISGGQRQRVAVGRAIVRKPAVFLMDEPLSNLDAKLRVQMRAEITDLHRRLGITFIYVTHDQAEAMTMSTRVAVMLDGELLQVGRPADIYADPIDRRVAEFIGSPKINMIEGTIRRDGGIECAGAVLPLATPLPPGTQVAVGIRPESVAIDDAGTAPAAGHAAIAGTVRLVENLGADLFVHVTGPEGAGVLIARAAPQTHGHLAPGDAVTVAIPARHALLFDDHGLRIRAAVAAGPVLAVVN